MSNTNELTVDVRGSLCPKPVIETKKVSDANPDAIITTIVDNEVSRDNVEKFGKSRGYDVAIGQDGIDFFIKLTPNVEPVSEIGCKPMNYSDRIILMTKDYLGEGSEELGRNLMKTFWVCMVEADVKPSIKKLADLGVEIAACGICLDYYGLKDQVGVGSITNMYAITDAIVGENVVKL